MHKFSQNCIRYRCSTIAYIKALVTLSTLKKMRLLGIKEKKSVGQTKKRMREKEKHGKLANNETLLYVGLYYIVQKRCSL